MEAISQEVRDHLELRSKDVIEELKEHWKGTEKGDELSALCPFHTETNPSFSYNSKKYNYNCLGCSANGKLKDLCEKLNITWSKSKSASSYQKLDPEEAVDLYHKTLLKSELDSWTGRGIERDSLLLGQIGVLTYSNGIVFDVFPYFDENHNFIAFKKFPRNKKDRKLTRWVPKGKGVPLYGLWFLPDYTRLEEPLFICEGEKDFWILKQAGYQVLAVGGAQTFPKKYISLIKDYKIYLIYDADKGGIDGVKTTMNNLSDLMVCELDPLNVNAKERFDINDLYLQDRDNFRDNISSLIEVAVNPFESELYKTIDKSTVISHFMNLDEIRTDRALISFQKKKEIALYIFNVLSYDGKWYYTKQLEFYYFSSVTKELFYLNGAQFQLLLHRIFGLNRSGSDHEFIMFELMGLSHQEGIETEISQVCCYSKEHNILYVYDNAHSLYRISFSKIEKVDNGTDGVLFLKDLLSDSFEVDVSTLPISDEKRKVLDIIFDNPNFSPSSNLNPDQAKRVFSFWFFYSFFLDYYPSKPFLALIGEKGSAKSMSLKLIRILFYGLQRKDLYSLSENGREAEDYVINNFLWFFDNQDEKLTGKRGWIMDFLALLSTGFEVSRRKHYENREMWSAIPRGIPAITSRTPYFRRDDIADRLLILELERRDVFIQDSEIYDNILSHRNELWQAVLSELQDILKALADPYKGEIKFRLADFAHFCCTIAKKENDIDYVSGIFEKLSEAQTEFALNEEPIFQSLEIWMENVMNHGVEISTKGLFKELKDIAEQNSIDGFPRSSVSLGKRLTNLRSNLKSHYKMVSQKGGQNKTFWVFRPLD